MSIVLTGINQRLEWWDLSGAAETSGGAWTGGTKCTPRFSSTLTADGKPYVLGLQMTETPRR